jgi:hypothetical protein
MNPEIIRIICAALGRLIELVIDAYEGSVVSARMVAEILPNPLRSELLLAAEKARLVNLKDK